MVSIQWRLQNRTHTCNLKLRREVFIGRSDDADIVLPHPQVSRRHAFVCESEGLLHIINYSRVNSIIVNRRGREHRLGYSENMVLRPGDLFHIGPTEFEVVEQAASAEG